MKTINIDVDANGGTTVEAEGFSGKECSDATKIIEQAIGKVTADRKTADYYKSSQQKQRQF